MKLLLQARMADSSETIETGGGSEGPGPSNDPTPRPDWSLLFIWSVSFVWLNQTNKMNQINHPPLSRLRSFHMLQAEIVEVGDGIRLGP
jgi:hypothetical protein